MSDTTSSSVETTLDAITTAEENLTQRAANELADEEFKGVATYATITHVISDNLESDEVLKLELELPNGKSGYITFSTYDYESGKMEEFLDNIGCTHSDMSSAFYETIPATYTEMYGWIILYDSYTPNLKVFTGDSKYRTISERFGSSRPVKAVQYLYATSLPVTTILLMAYMGAFTTGAAIGSAVIGFLVWVFIWYCDAAWSGMSMPDKKQVEDISMLE